MGSATEFFGFLTESPDTLSDTVSNFSHITIMDSHKKVRSELKLYRDESIEKKEVFTDSQLSLF